MQRVLRQVLRAAVLPILALMAVAISPMGGVASAATASTSCWDGEGYYCYLVISAPGSVVAGQPFTVQVFVMTYDSNEHLVLAKSDFCAPKVAVTLRVYAGESEQFYDAYARGGIATFNISVPGGSYLLEAQQPSNWENHAPPLPPAACDGNYNSSPDEAVLTAVTIPSDQPIAPCPPDVTCVQTASGTGSAATLIADGGTFISLFDSDFFNAFIGSGMDPVAGGCGEPADTAGGVLGFTLAPANTFTKTIVFALSPELITKGIGLYNVCWQSNVSFTPRAGTSLAEVSCTAGTCYQGVLPDCKKDDVGPCVVSRTSDQYNAGYFKVRAPEWDPKGYVW